MFFKINSKSACAENPDAYYTPPLTRQTTTDCEANWKQQATVSTLFKIDNQIICVGARWRLLKNFEVL
ncbi:hypothetical protein, partial [Marinomonas aquimarina]|uniref:hypothetical protein n=1 Tax=Marinomonas aquimarina TaxID=295068 RepID=UPI001E4C4DFF